MTWGEFKAKVEAEGVTDDMRFRYIDITGFDDWSIHIDEDEEEGEKTFYVI